MVKKTIGAGFNNSHMSRSNEERREPEAPKPSIWTLPNWVEVTTESFPLLRRTYEEVKGREGPTKYLDPKENYRVTPDAYNYYEQNRALYYHLKENGIFEKSESEISENDKNLLKLFEETVFPAETIELADKYYGKNARESLRNMTTSELVELQEVLHTTRYPTRYYNTIKGSKNAGFPDRRMQMIAFLDEIIQKPKHLIDLDRKIYHAYYKKYNPTTIKRYFENNDVYDKTVVENLYKQASHYLDQLYRQHYPHYLRLTKEVATFVSGEMFSRAPTALGLSNSQLSGEEYNALYHLRGADLGGIVDIEEEKRFLAEFGELFEDPQALESENDTLKPFYPEKQKSEIPSGYRARDIHINMEVVQKDMNGLILCMIDTLPHEHRHEMQKVAKARYFNKIIGEKLAASEKYNDLKKQWAQATDQATKENIVGELYAAVTQVFQGSEMAISMPSYTIKEAPTPLKGFKKRKYKFIPTNNFEKPLSKKHEKDNHVEVYLDNIDSLDDVFQAFVEPKTLTKSQEKYAGDYVALMGMAGGFSVVEKADGMLLCTEHMTDRFIQDPSKPKQTYGKWNEYNYIYMAHEKDARQIQTFIEEIFFHHQLDNRGVYPEFNGGNVIKFEDLTDEEKAAKDQLKKFSRIAPKTVKNDRGDTAFVMPTLSASDAFFLSENLKALCVMVEDEVSMQKISSNKYAVVFEGNLEQLAEGMKFFNNSLVKDMDPRSMIADRRILYALTSLTRQFDNRDKKYLSAPEYHSGIAPEGALEQLEKHQEAMESKFDKGDFYVEGLYGERSISELSRRSRGKF